ncbi:MAG: ATP12 family chaperone protein [Sphingorhabdus sp.]
MRRFWKDVSLERGAQGQGIRLDGRALKTPKKNAFYLPTAALADAVAEEWSAVGEQIDPAQMPMTGFANAAIDHVAADPAGFAALIAAYAENDAFCYRAEATDALAKRQAEVWDPWLDWAKGRYNVSFTLVEGIMHQPQPIATLEKLSAAVAAQDMFELAAMAKLAHLSGSLIAVLALVERAGRAEILWQAACLDELWQEELWGSDYWAQKNRTDREAEFMQAARFLHLLRN